MRKFPYIKSVFMNSLTAFQLIVDKIQKIYSIRESENIAKILIEDLFGSSYLIDNQLFSNEEQGILNNAVEELLQEKPIQYITGIADFYGYQFIVNKHVLIPRPETEELVYEILSDNKSIMPQTILDIGSGSGCIPIAIAKERPMWNVKGIDISEEALAVARKNAVKNNVDVKFVQFDILNQKIWEDMSGMLDVIVSNPPYIPLEEKNLMASNVLNYEPHLALFVEELDPLIFYKRIIEFASEKLIEGGKLYFECNENNADSLKNYALDHPIFESVFLKKDLQDRNRILGMKKIYLNK